MIRRWLGVSCALALVGCGAVATFKPGAGPDRMQADEHACGQAGSEGFEECMRNLGWYVSRGEIGSPPPTAAPVVAAAPAADPEASPPATVVPAAAVAASAATATVAAVAPAAAVPTPAAVVEADAGEPSPSPTPTMRMAVGPQPTGPPGSESLPRVRVGSWWKLGGSAAGLNASVATCVGKLGAPHQPTANAVVVTIGMRDCLRGDGWIAYDQEAVPPNE